MSALRRLLTPRIFTGLRIRKPQPVAYEYNGRYVYPVRNISMYMIQKLLYTPVIHPNLSYQRFMGINTYPVPNRVNRNLYDYSKFEVQPSRYDYSRFM